MKVEKESETSIERGDWNHDRKMRARPAFNGERVSFFRID